MEQQIAVITATIQGFENWVRDLYNETPNDKSLFISHIKKQATIEHPFGVKRKYIPIMRMEDLQGQKFDNIEKTSNWFLLTNCDEILEYANTRILGS